MPQRLAINVELVHSPDDDGWYFHEYHLIEVKSRLSVGIYDSETKAMDAYYSGDVTWEEWS